MPYSRQRDQISRAPFTRAYILSLSHPDAQPDGATGGVYKGQGRIQYKLIQYAYKTLPVYDL